MVLSKLDVARRKHQAKNSNLKVPGSVLGINPLNYFQKRNLTHCYLISPEPHSPPRYVLNSSAHGPIEQLHGSRLARSLFFLLLDTSYIQG